MDFGRKLIKTWGREKPEKAKHFGKTEPRNRLDLYGQCNKIQIRMKKNLKDKKALYSGRGWRAPGLLGIIPSVVLFLSIF